MAKKKSILDFYKMKENFFSGVIFASFLKFSFLFFSSQIVINLFIEGEVAKKLLFMMSYPQFLTALFGGALAFLLSFLIKKGKIENNYNSVL